jgi:hypothetical protein
LKNVIGMIGPVYATPRADAPVPPPPVKDTDPLPAAPALVTITAPTAVPASWQ